MKSTVSTGPPAASVIASVHRRLSLPAQRALRQSTVSVQRFTHFALDGSHACMPAALPVIIAAGHCTTVRSWSYAERDEVSGTLPGDPGTLSRIAHAGLGGQPQGFAWLPARKAAVPDRIAGYFHRAELVQRYLPTRRRLTVLKAPAGFGKTTLLAECCRSAMAKGVPTVWLSVDEQDEPETFATCLSRAFGRLEVFDTPTFGPEDGPPVGRTLWPLLQAIEVHGAPCVLALDELERLSDPESVELVNVLLKRGPPNLHLAIACRDFPTGLAVAAQVLEGQAMVATAEHLRFSPTESAAFLADGAALGEAAAPEPDSAGWPLALRVLRERRLDATHAGRARNFAGTSLDARMWRAMPTEDRDLVLDAGLLERIEPELLDEALAGHGLWQRLRSMATIDGLLLPAADAEDGAHRLHPLLAECCTESRRREAPERFREVHRRIARALGRRGDIVSAMRHATEGDDPELAAGILEAAGGLRLMFREGFPRLQAADRFLTPTILAGHPRLALARALVLTLTGRLQEAPHGAAGFVQPASASVTWDGDAGQRELYLDDVFVRGLGVFFSTPSWASPEVATLRTQMADAVASTEIDPLMRSTLEFSLCVLHGAKAEFDEALSYAERARTAFGHTRSYVRPLLDYQVGMIAMARGQVLDAAAWYGRARHTLSTHFQNDPRTTSIGEALSRELELERNRLTSPLAPIPVPNAFDTGCSPFQAYAAASATVVELRLQDRGLEAALDALQEMLDHSYRANLPGISRYLSALHVATLADAGRLDDAQRTWRLAGLPPDDDGCLDLDRQTWREMEALAEARLKLLRARRDFDAARTFSRAVAETVERRGLRRTRMRCLALSMTVEVAAGDLTAAAEHLTGFLRLFAATDYARPLVRDAEVAWPLLESHIDAATDPALAAAARTLHGHLQAAAAEPRGARLTSREREVLRRLETQRDRDIALALGISHAGVRYHVRRLFEKLDARSRMDAVHRARRMGLFAER